MEIMSVVMPMIAAVFGALLTFMVGQVSAKLNGITASIDAVEKRLKEEIISVETRTQIQINRLETSHSNHITHPGIHGEAVAKLTEQINSLLKTAQIAHERIDHLKDRLKT